jgi:hypothetical protein
LTGLFANLMVYPVYLIRTDLVLLCLGGVGVNFGPVWGQVCLFKSCSTLTIHI